MRVAFKITFQEYENKEDTNYWNTYTKRTKCCDIIKHKIGQPRQKWLYDGEVMNDDTIPRQIFRFKQ